MTEAEWPAFADPGPMLRHLTGKISERKLRLFACGCSRRLLPLLRDPRLEEVLLLAEQLAEGMASAKERLLVLVDAIQTEATATPPATAAYQGIMGFLLVCCFPNHAMFELGLRSLANAVAWDTMPGATIVEDDWASPHDPEWQAAYTAERRRQAILLRDVVANPFRPVALPVLWLSSTVVQLAQAVYDERAFDRLPILADALEEAGCTDTAILGHCRQPGEHVRGCWVIDLLLGKQ